MSRVVCKNCGREKGFLEVNLVESWHKCSKHGPICPDCDESKGLMGLGGKVCPKCGDNIDSRQGNVQTNLIQCTSCSSIHRLNQLVENHEQKPTGPVYKSNFDYIVLENLIN